MYCGNCGHKNLPNSKFCGKCGKKLESKPARQIIKNQKKSKTGRFASIGSAIVLICFFLPWIVVSCGASEMEISGNEFASGHITVSEGVDSFTASLSELLSDAGVDDTSSGSGGYPALYLIIVCSLLGFLGLSGKRGGSLLALAGGVVGLIIMLVAHSKFSGFEDDLSSYAFGALRMEYEFPYYAEWFGFAIQSFLGFLGIIGA